MPAVLRCFLRCWPRHGISGKDFDEAGDGFFPEPIPPLAPTAQDVLTPIFQAEPGQGAAGSERAAQPQQCSHSWVEKAVPRKPEFRAGARAHVGQVFVHGDGDCDQLGLGDDYRERKKPTLLGGDLAGIQVRTLACGAMHTLCVAADGSLFSWGCGDDGALGRPPGNADAEPKLVTLPDNAALVAEVACGDSHSCALDAKGSLWLWGSYKDSNGYIGIAHPDGRVVQKSFRPLALHSDVGAVRSVACGANHTIALAAASKKVYTWGSNQSRQLGLAGDDASPLVHSVVCGAAMVGMEFAAFDDAVIATRPDMPKASRVLSAELLDGGVVEPKFLLGTEILAKFRSVTLERTDREVLLGDKQALLRPQTVGLAGIGQVEAVYASCDCTFLTTADGRAFGCGLNADGQVGVGFCSTAVFTLTQVKLLRDALWIGGGARFSAALVGPRVLTWGRAEECGQGLGAAAPPVLEPSPVQPPLPPLRTVRCGMAHTLACSESGDVYLWGCGMSHQLGNCPRNSDKPHESSEEPIDEISPYQLSAKKLANRFVLLADGGAQHSVELVWQDEASESTAANVCLAQKDDEEGSLLGGGAVATKGACTQGAVSDPRCDFAKIDVDEENVEPIKVETREDFWRVQVEAVYRRRNPYKLDNVPSLLEKYRGQEAVLYTKVCLKYLLDPKKFYADPCAWDDEEGNVQGEDAEKEQCDAQGAATPPDSVCPAPEVAHFSASPATALPAQPPFGSLFSSNGAGGGAGTDGAGALREASHSIFEFGATNTTVFHDRKLVPVEAASAEGGHGTDGVGLFGQSALFSAGVGSEAHQENGGTSGEDDEDEPLPERGSKPRRAKRRVGGVRKDLKNRHQGGAGKGKTRS